MDPWRWTWLLDPMCRVLPRRVPRPDAPRPYKTWGYPLVPLAFMAVYVWFLVPKSKPLESHTGLALIPVYWAYRSWARGRSSAA